MNRAKYFQILVLILLVLFAFLPIMLLGIGSLAQGWYWPDLLPRKAGLRAWRYLLTPGAGILPALTTSLGLAISVTISSLLLALPAARVLAWQEFRGKRAVLFILLIPVLAPPLAAMMGVHVAFLHLSLSDSLLGVALVHLLQTVPYSTLMLRSSLTRFDQDFEAQARTLGAPAWYVWRHVTLPAIAPGALVAGAFAFLISWSQYLSTLLIGGGRIVTLPLILVAFQRGSDEAVTAALSLVFLLPAILVGWMMASHQKISGETNFQ
jgi:putative spermidine/putrescine transport system permease protein